MITRNNQKVSLSEGVPAGEFQASGRQSKRSCSNADAFRKFHLIEGQNAHDQIRMMRYKRAWSDHVLWVPFSPAKNVYACSAKNDT